MHYIVMEIALIIMENHGIVLLNFYGNPDLSTSVLVSFLYGPLFLISSSGL